MTPSLSRPIARLSLLVGVLLLATLIACRTERPEDVTPAPTVDSPSLVPQEVPITTLLRNPASFEGQTIQVTGQYQALPLLVCRGETHRSPATWTLVFGDVEVFVSGFDAAIRPLAAGGLSLTVEGRWQEWEGPVGCGRRAPTQEIWYLDASRIVSPNPLVRESDDEIVLVPSPTPDGETPGEEATAAGPPTITPEGEEPEEEPTEGPAPTRTPSPTFQSIPPTLPGPTNTPRPTATFGPNGGEATNTPTPTTSPTTGPGGTAETGTPTTTATATTAASPGATSEPSDQGTLDFDDVEKQTLAANSPHSWQFSPPADEPIIITVGAGLNLNINLELVAPDGTVIEKANDGGPGEPERITYTTPNPAGDYEIIVSGVNGTSGPYILMAFDSQSEPVVVMQDTLNYGSGGSGSIPEGVDHYWNFEGEAGDVITVEVSPTGSTGDLILYLIGPDGADLVGLINETEGGSESLVDFTLPATGFYSIGIGEYDFLEVDYSMTLTQ